MQFSRRIGSQPTPNQIQIESASDELRNSLWNVILPRFGGSPDWAKAAGALAEHHFKTPIDRVPQYDNLCKDWVQERFFGADWDGMYDILEFLVTNVDYICKPAFSYQSFYHEKRWTFIDAVNVVLTRELSGYRFVNGVLAPISNPEEVAAIEDAAAISNKKGILGAQEHLFTALRLLGQKPLPDYRNSIKESTSAVEAVVAIATGAGGGVAEAVDKLSTKTEIHGALKAAIKQLYGYTSDSSGIRHALLDQPNTGYDEAKFMLVACSAFINFFVAKASSAGLLK